jgi:hypothetical protein
MSFTFSERHLQEYQQLGYTVFRGIVPPSLVADLRRACERGREQARERHGAQAQRFQPVARYDLDLEPFAAFRDLPELREAVARVLSPRHTYCDVNLIGVLIEPAERPWCTKWHRDWRDNAPFLDLAEWEAVFYDRDYLNQSNCALYWDPSFWAVPGSQLRGDLAPERALFPDRPIPPPDLEGLSAEAAERAALAYAQRMPGAVPIPLDAGDFCLYRSTLWHLGNYVPYCRRATLHDFIDTPEYLAWRTRMREDLDRRKAAGHAEWEWNRVAD